jgi:hypothetical protein
MTKAKERRREREKERLLKRFADFKEKSRVKGRNWHKNKLPVLLKDLVQKGYVFTYEMGDYLS